MESCSGAHQQLKKLFVSQAADAEPTITSNVEEASKASIRRNLPSRTVDVNAVEEAGLQYSVRYQRSLDIRGTVPKHCRAKPVVKGSGYTGAILSDMDSFEAFVEMLLCYHALCHKYQDLPRELQEDLELIDFASRMIVQYFDTILYRGDDSVDSDTCKIHSQLHTYLIELFGNLMQYNTETGERGLKFWGKGPARTALKNGRDVFTHSTSNRVAEWILLNKAGPR